MLSDEVRARLVRMHAPVSPHWPPASASSRIAPSHDLFERGEECQNASGRHWRLRRRLADIWPRAEHDMAPLVQQPFAADHRHVELAALAEYWPHATLFVDLETCGFAGSMVFLAGLVWQADGELVVDQLLARSYTEERALLEALWQVAACNRVLVTFNGKSFDWPMVHDRSTRHHLGRRVAGAKSAELVPSARSSGMQRHDARPELVHCDLLHHARRRWKHELPDCRLQTLERFICRRARRDDVPGALVPAAYHRFVRTGDTSALEHILSHNALDLETLVQVACTILHGARMGQTRPPMRSAG
jgi:uncharacterized protein YprB with RNaseH-like and TPR domain